MKFLTPVFLLLLFNACLHKKVVVNRLEGNWNLEKQMNTDGSYSYFSNVHIQFSSGKADGKTYLDCTTDSAGVVSVGNYLVSKNGEELFINYDLNNLGRKDQFTIEDMDKNSLVVRNQGIVRFFKKI